MAALYSRFQTTFGRSAQKGSESSEVSPPSDLVFRESKPELLLLVFAGEVFGHIKRIARFAVRDRANRSRDFQRLLVKFLRPHSNAHQRAGHRHQDRDRRLLAFLVDVRDMRQKIRFVRRTLLLAFGNLVE